MQANEVRGVEACAACGGDPGGIIWEGRLLPAVLTVDDITGLLQDAVDRRTVVRLFTAGQLHGSRPGKQWLIRASQFVADWARLEQQGRVSQSRSRQPQPALATVVAR